MGREAKILLAFLGLLAGVFVGVLSMKLLVPRPPAGAGPDIHATGPLAAASFVEPTAIVDPPGLTLAVAAFAAAPPLMPDAGNVGEPPDARPLPGTPLMPQADPRSEEELKIVAPVTHGAETTAPADDLLPPPAEFVLAPPARPIDPIDEIAPDARPEAPQDPFVTRTGWHSPTDDSPISPPPVPETGFSSRRPAASGSHVTQPGDSWWSVAEAAYGDGRFYRALFAWNRALEPRISLAVGTRLEVPPREKLEAAWPKLVPAGGSPAFDRVLAPDSR